MSKLYLMMGTPGAGKSTYAKKYLSNGITYISRDEIRYSMVKPNEKYFSKEKQVYQEFINQINNALLKNEDVCADQTSLDRASRAKLIRQLYPKPTEIIVIWINPPLETILKQNAYRTGRERVPEDRVIEMFNRMQAPSYIEGFSEIYVVDGSEEE